MYNQIQQLKHYDSLYLELAQNLLHAQVDQQNQPNQNPIQNGIEILGNTQYSFAFDITRNKIKSQCFWISLDKFLNLKQKWQDGALWRTKILPQS